MSFGEVRNVEELRVACSSSSSAVAVRSPIIDTVLISSLPRLRRPRDAAPANQRCFSLLDMIQGVTGKVPPDSRALASVTVYTLGGRSPKCCVAIRMLRSSPDVKLWTKNEAASFPERSRGEHAKRGTPQRLLNKGDAMFWLRPRGSTRAGHVSNTFQHLSPKHSVSGQHARPFSVILTRWY